MEKQRKINLISINAKSGAGKDYVVSVLNFIRKSYKENIQFIIKNPEDFETKLNLLNRVSSSDIKSSYGIDWGRPNVIIERFSTPLRNIVQAVAGTNFTPDEMDSQEVKLYTPEHLGGTTMRDLHLLLSDAVKDNLACPDIFSILLKQRVLKNVSNHNFEEELDIILLDVRYPFELEISDQLKTELTELGYLVETTNIHITSEKYNEINHSSEQDLYGANKDKFDIVFKNDKNRTTVQTLESILWEVYVKTFEKC